MDGGSVDASAVGRSIEINGIRLNVLIEGQGPDVLLVHGFPDSLEVWRRQIPVLVAAGYRVIAPDMRGCGLSDAPRERAAYAIDRLIADLLALLDALGIGKVHLVAHDWGAVIAWQFCTLHPERVHRYVALSVGHPAVYAQSAFEQKLKGWYVLFLQIPWLSEWLLRLGGWWWFRKITGFEDEAPNWMAKLSRPGRLTAAVNYYRANLKMLLNRSRPRVQVPVMGIWSDGDRFLTESQMIESAAVVEAPWRYERISGANHWLQLTAADHVNALLLDFLASDIQSSALHLSGACRPGLPRRSG